MAEDVPLDLLKPADFGNPRAIDTESLAALKESVAQFGDVSGIVLDAVHGLVCGHQRLRALAERYGEGLRLTREDDGTLVLTTPDGGRFVVREVEWPLAVCQAANVAANSPLITGAFTPAVGDVVADVAAALPELSDALRLPEIEVPAIPTRGLTHPDAVPAPTGKQAVTRRGDLWLCGEHKILCGDCTDAAAVERLLDGQRPVLLVTSPPYMDAREYGGADIAVEHLAEFVPLWGLQCDLLVVNLGIVRKDNAVVPYWDTYIAAATNAGLKLLSWNVWDRGQPWSMAQNTAMFPLEHEFVLVFGESRLDVRCTVANKTPGARTGITNRQADGTLVAAPTKVVRTHRPLGSVFRSPPHIGRDIGHPAMFPVALPTAYVEACSLCGEICADPFSGSGTTLIACEQLGRRCYAMELEPAYCDVAVLRWQAFTGEQAVLLGSGQTFLERLGELPPGEPTEPPVAAQEPTDAPA